MELGMGVKNKVESAKLRFNQEKAKEDFIKGFSRNSLTLLVKI